MDKGLKLLFSTYWSGGMWGYQKPTPEDFEQAKREGYMFDPPEARTHDETLELLRRVLEQISPSDVANAFLFSLSTRKLQYRSALGSYYYAMAIPDHSHDGNRTCYFCDWMELKGNAYNVFNFERYKWGGVRHTSPEYALFDLEQFLLLPKVIPSSEDWDILKSILHAMNELPKSKKAGAYRELITKKETVEIQQERS